MADRALCNSCGKYVDLVYSSSNTTPLLSHRRDISVTVEARCVTCGTVLYAGTQAMTLNSQQGWMDYQVEEK